jgi:hypothetical protein
MRSIRLSLIAATAIAVAGSATAFAADTAGRSDIGTYSASPNYLRNPVPIVIGAGESRQTFYVEADSANAPTTAFAGAPITASRGVPVLQGMGESAQQVYVPANQAPQSRFGLVPVQSRRG